MLPSTVHALISSAAVRAPEAVYAVTPDGTRRLTYGDLVASCLRVGTLLRAAGLQRGDTVSVVMPNGMQTLRLMLGTMHSGLTVNPINLLSQPEQMAYVLTHSDAKLVCVAPEWEQRVRDALAARLRPPVVWVVDPNGHWAEPADTPAQAPSDPAPRPDAVALLMYTSGTTGTPKGVMLTQANLAANAVAISVEHALTAQDRVLAVLPLFHINGFVVTMLSPLAAGGSLALPPKFSAARFWSDARDCSWINVVPTMISYLLEGSTPPRAQTASIRFCRSASSALPAQHHMDFERRFGIPIVETMGLTETAAPSFSNPLNPAQRKIGSVGRASGCEARVIDPQERPVADGVTGELAIRGPHVMAGYHKDAQATRTAFTADGWLRTGDLGHRDGDGFYFVTGRIKELIIKGGENIAPREIDEVLLQHPAVLDAAAVGVPDRHYGQDILACVVLRDAVTCSEDDLRSFCVERLGRYKSPAQFRFVSELPRGPSGKVQRLKLLDTAT
jgi:acyl-CoA synthetase (AMP-forming)/AMP-acid ligase II